MMKQIFAVATILIFSVVVQAHEFWIASSKFYYSVGETFSMDLRVGEDFIGEISPVTKDRLKSVELHQQTNVQDLKPIIKENVKELISFPLASTGSHVVALQTNEKFIELDAEKFN